MDNIFEPNADLEGMLIPPQPPISLLSLGWAVILGFELLCPLEPPCLPYPPILNRGSGGHLAPQGSDIWSIYGPPFAVIVAVACVIAIAMALTVMVGEVDAAVGQLASRQVGN